MSSANRKLKSTPPTIINNLCQAGLERNSHGFSGCFICSVSIASSIIPEILTYPPNGNQPTAYSVSLFLGLNLKRVNQGSKNKQNFSTRTLKRRAKRKCPPSCIITSSERLIINWRARIKNVSIGLFTIYNLQ